MSSDSEEQFEESAPSEEDIEESSHDESEDPPNKKIKLEHPRESQKNKKDLRKPPTAEELNNLRETENLYNSNLFRFQIDGLLDEIKVKEKYIKTFENWLNQFDKFVKEIPEYDEIQFSQNAEETKIPKRIKRLEHLLLKNYGGVYNNDKDITIKLVRPQNYYMFDLYKMNLTVGPSLTVTAAIELPRACFLEKDYLNNRYVVKSKFYMSYIFVQFLNSALFSNVSYIDECMVIEAMPHSSKKIRIHFHFIPPTDLFKLPRFHPSQNNIRDNVFKDFVGINLNELKLHGTPFYNSFVLSEVTFKSNMDYIQQFLKNLTSIQDGVKLLLVWLMQRNLCFEFGGFSYRILLNLVVYMTRKKKINQYMSSYQVIRNVWVFLSTYNWSETPISMQDSIAPEMLQKFKDAYEVVFVDDTESYNIASFLNLEVYLRIRQEAKLAIQFLDNTNFDTFQALFLKKLEPELQYDGVLR